MDKIACKSHKQSHKLKAARAILFLSTGGGINKRNVPQGVYATSSLGVGYIDSPGKMPAGHWKPRQYSTE